MKILLLSIFVLCFSLLLDAQETGKEPRYSFRFSSNTIKEVMGEIERKSGLFFSYNPLLLEHCGEVNAAMNEMTLPEVLNELFNPYGIDYKILRQYIILSRKSRYHTISGTVKDAESGESLIGSTIYDMEQSLGTTSNEHGFFSLSLREGEVCLTLSFVGYNPEEITFQLQKDTVIHVTLRPNIYLEEVAVRGEGLATWVKSIQPGQMQFPVKVADALPSLMSESDVLRTLQMLPGVKSGNEGLAGLYVRGGNVDENLYLMDGIPLYNPSHLMGFFSTFNSNAVKHVDFYKGSFPARYGGRLSSVMDVRMKEGNMEELHGNFSIGLIASKFDLEGPLEKGKTSFVCSFRRTYMDLFMKPLIRKLTEEKENGSERYNTGGYYFTDINAKVTRKFSDRQQLSLSLYWGKDHAKFSDHYFNRETYSYTGDNAPAEGYTYQMVGKSRWKWDWGNLIAFLEYGSGLSSRLYGRFALSYNRYMSDIDFKRSEHHSNEYPGSTETRSYSVNGNEYRSGIEDLIAKAAFEYNWNHRHQLRFGGEYIHHIFTPEVSRMISYLKEEWLEPVEGGFEQRNGLDGDEVSLYLEDEITLSERFRIHPGIRFSFFRVERKNYYSVEPRFSLQYALNDRLSLKASYAEMSQYVHLLAFGGMNMPSDLWVPVTRKIRPMLSRQAAGGLYYRFGKGWNFTLEGYYKTMKNQIEYLDGATVLPEYRNWEEHVAVGRGDAYGMEMQLQKDLGKTTGWFNYTLAWANRWFPGKEINHGDRYPAKNDSRHGVNIVLLHRFNEKFDISAVWVYNSGARATVALEKYKGAGIEGVDDNDYLMGEIEHIEYRNNYKLPDYHRLDLGVNFHKIGKRGVSTWSFSIYNVYSRMNPFFVYTDTREVKGNGDKVSSSFSLPLNNSSSQRYRTVIKQASIFPIIPSFSYMFTF